MGVIALNNCIFIAFLPLVSGENKEGATSDDTFN
jgi:hypothetical protein